DHVLPAHEAEMDPPAVVQPLHDVVDRVVHDLVLARVREALDALERQRVVADLLPAELEAAALLAAEFPEVINRAVREEDPPVGQVVDVVDGDAVLPALRPGDRAGVPVEDAAVMDVIAGDDVAPVHVAGPRAVAGEQHAPAAAACELVAGDPVPPGRVPEP